MELFINDHLKFTEEHKKLLTAQVVLADSLVRITDRLDRLVEAQAHTEERLNALIAVVDDIVRRPPQ